MLNSWCFCRKKISPGFPDFCDVNGQFQDTKVWLTEFLNFSHQFLWASMYQLLATFATVWQKVCMCGSDQIVNNFRQLSNINIWVNFFQLNVAETNILKYGHNFRINCEKGNSWVKVFLSFLRHLKSIVKFQ